MHWRAISHTLVLLLVLVLVLAHLQPRLGRPDQREQALVLMTVTQEGPSARRRVVLAGVEDGGGGGSCRERVTVQHGGCQAGVHPQATGPAQVQQDPPGEGVHCVKRLSPQEKCSTNCYFGRLNSLRHGICTYAVARGVAAAWQHWRALSSRPTCEELAGHSVFDNAISTNALFGKRFSLGDEAASAAPARLSTSVAHVRNRLDVSGGSCKVQTDSWITEEKMIELTRRWSPAVTATCSGEQ
jgi:hypothetical protein